ncbi:hypothetical protein F4824DRAFT_187123 [Ustulina deusta]|nr:hypothetical protein F4824DRAFT_187123 [Ustulina deusta]
MDATNPDANATPQEAHEAAWKEQQAMWDEIYPEPTNPDQGGDQLLSDDVAEACISFAEQHLSELEPCIDLIETQYATRAPHEMDAFLDAITAVLPILCRRLHLARALATSVSQYCEDPFITFRAMGLRIEVRVYAGRLHVLARRILHQLNAMRAEGRAQPEVHVPGDRGEEAPRAWKRPVVTPWRTHHTRRPLGRQRLSCDLRWKREARGRRN